YDSDKPLQRQRWSLLDWREGMNLPRSYQGGLGARLLSGYAWWKLEPHPNWITPRGTTLFGPRPGDAINHFRIDLLGEWSEAGDWHELGLEVPTSEWRKQH